MIRATIARMARHVKQPPALAPRDQLPQLRSLLASAQSPLGPRSNASSFRNFASAAHSLPSQAPVPWNDSSRRFQDRWSVGSCHSERIRGFRRSAWLAQTPIHLPRGFASSSKDADAAAAAASPAGASEPGLSDGVSGSPGDSLAQVAESARNAVQSLIESSRDAAGKMFPNVDNWMDPSGGGVTELVVPVTTSITVSLAAWLLLPTILRKLHSYVEAGPTARLLGRLPQEKQPYELSVFSAMEMPLRLLATTITFSYL